MKMVKRLFDFIVSLIIIIISLPLFLLIGAIIRLDLGPPIVFIQERPGFKKKSFYLIKFRTMTNYKNKNGKLLSDSDRLTIIGRFLRLTSLDELPTMINVLKGDMSLVGPRPLLMQYLERYSPEQARRHEVKPGITGWAQVNGRNAISWEEKFNYDLWYVDNHSFWLDIKILFITVLKVLKREGISASQHDTMPEFLGTFSKKI